MAQPWVQRRRHLDDGARGGRGRGLGAVALSPDGTQLAYAANDQLYLRPLAQADATAIRGTDSGQAPFFSSDGRWIAFWQRSALRKVPVSGRAPVTVVETLLSLWGARWERDDTILLGQGPGGIVRVSGAGGTPETLVTVEDGEEAAGPMMLPGDEWVLFTLRPSGASSWDDAQILAQSLETGERRVLIPGGQAARYVATGHLVYALEGTVFAVPFDAGSLVATGGAVPLVDGVGTASNGLSNLFDLSEGGTFASVGDIQGETTLAWVDRAGQMTPLREGGSYAWPDLSPDGDQVVFTELAGRSDLWLYDIGRDALTRFTADARSSIAVWTPDGAGVVYGSDAAGFGTYDLYEKPADGSAPAELLFASSNPKVPASWSADATTLVFHELTEAGAERDLWVVERGGAASPFLATEFDELAPSVSPDGRWLAYVSDLSGEDRVQVQPFPDGGAVVPISTGVGTEPVWARDGTELFFRDGNRMMAVDVDLGGTFSAGRPRVLFDEAYEPDPLGVGIRNYDVAADGRFLMIRGTPGVTQIDVVLNWLEELKERVPVD